MSPESFFGKSELRLYLSTADRPLEGCVRVFLNIFHINEA